jgi:hypothetical protein
LTFVISEGDRCGDFWSWCASQLRRSDRVLTRTVASQGLTFRDAFGNCQCRVADPSIPAMPLTVRFRSAWAISPHASGSCSGGPPVWRQPHTLEVPKREAKPLWWHLMIVWTVLLRSPDRRWLSHPGKLDRFERARVPEILGIDLRRSFAGTAAADLFAASVDAPSPGMTSIHRPLLSWISSPWSPPRYIRGNREICDGDAASVWPPQSFRRRWCASTAQ